MPQPNSINPVVYNNPANAACVFRHIRDIPTGAETQPAAQQTIAELLSRHCSLGCGSCKEQHGGEGHGEQPGNIASHNADTGCVSDGVSANTELSILPYPAVGEFAAIGLLAFIIILFL